MMKSPRKTLLGAGVALLFAPLAFVAAQNPVKPPKPNPDATQPAPTATQPAAPAATPAPANRPGENPPRMSDMQARITVNSNLVILPVTVKDRAGELVPDLKRDEFRVFEDKVEQHIDMFTTEAFPLSMVVLIDNDLKDKDAEKVQASLLAILGGLSTEDEAFICRFDQFFHPGKGFTNDQDKLSKELKRTSLDTEADVAPPSPQFSGTPTINNHSATDDSAIDKGAQAIKGQPTKALDDAMFAAAMLLHGRPRNRRRVILLVSDGVNGGKKFNKVSADDVMKALLAENVSVYSIAVPSSFLERKISPVDRARSPLIRYAEHTGGEVYHATNERSFEEFYSRLTEEARNQYTLAYVPRGTDQSADYHSIEVRVKREGLDIKTRDGYYSDQLPAGQRP
ncbi:MAG TPA: VWA domain-containing protein [Candidatus Acidoferrum sp.]|jgi:VWFA-related protein|nr:VWA domain-containing protein [Candidatus Acidoferrum sp.]